MLSKGFCWCADSDDAALYWSHAGASLEIDCLGRWWATLPQDRWPEEAVATILADFDDSNNSDNRVGDRLQELVFIGPRFGETRSQTLVGECLDQCLLMSDEYHLYKTLDKEQRCVTFVNPLLMKAAR